MKNKMYRALLLAAALWLLTGNRAGAAAFENAVIDSGAKGTLSIVKYDEAVRQNAPIFASYAATGLEDAALEEAGASFGLPGIVFSCLWVGDIRTATEQIGGTQIVRTLYGVAPELRTLLSLSDAEGRRAPGSDTVYYTPERVREALQTGGSFARSSALTLLAAEKGRGFPATDAGGRTSLTGLPLGLYLVAETAVTENVDSASEPFLVTLPMASAADGWKYSVTVYPKNATSVPELSKEVAEITEGKTVRYGRCASASSGDTVSYRIGTKLQSISTVQTYYTELKWTDRLSPGLSYCRGDVQLAVYPDGSFGEASFSLQEDCYSVSYGKEAGDETMLLRVNEKGLALLNRPDRSGSVIGITYGARLLGTEALVLGTVGNHNTVELNWVRGGNTAAEGSLTSGCSVYSFGLDLTKEFSDNGGDSSRVLFKLQNSSDGCFVKLTGGNGIYFAAGTAAADCEEASLAPDAAGRLRVYGLEDGCYTLTELQTAPGYNLLREAVLLEISLTEDRDPVTGGETGTVTVSAAVNGSPVSLIPAEGSPAALLPLTVINQKGFDLPATGETGRILLPLSGFLGAWLLLGLSLRERRRCRG